MMAAFGRHCRFTLPTRILLCERLSLSFNTTAKIQRRTLMGSDYHINSAQPADFDAIVALLQKNAAGNGGALNGNYPPGRVSGMLDRATAYTLVAKREGRVVGVLFSALSAENSTPVVSTMLDAWPPGRECWLYGPVCIAASERGQGLLRPLYAAMREHYGSKTPVLFIQSNNIPSLRAHQHLGMQEVARFDCDDESFRVLTDAA
jgi:predicted GNAT superfamily acetyltransferase